MADQTPKTDKPGPTTPKGAHVYTVAPDQAFLDTVARGVLERMGGDPLKRSDVTILVR